MYHRRVRSSTQAPGVLVTTDAEVYCRYQYPDFTNTQRDIGPPRPVTPPPPLLPNFADEHWWPGELLYMPGLEGDSCDDDWHHNVTHPEKMGGGSYFVIQQPRHTQGRIMLLSMNGKNFLRALQERGRTRLNHKRRIGRPNVFVTNAKIFMTKALFEKPYTTHSIRRSAARWAARCGADDSTIKRAGRWKSSSFELYTQDARAELITELHDDNPSQDHLLWIHHQMLSCMEGKPCKPYGRKTIQTNGGQPFKPWKENHTNHHPSKSWSMGPCMEGKPCIPYGRKTIQTNGGHHSNHGRKTIQTTIHQSHGQWDHAWKENRVYHMEGKPFKPMEGTIQTTEGKPYKPPSIKVMVNGTMHGRKTVYTIWKENHSNQWRAPFKPRKENHTNHHPSKSWSMGPCMEGKPYSFLVVDELRYWKDFYLDLRRLKNDWSSHNVTHPEKMGGGSYFVIQQPCHTQGRIMLLSMNSKHFLRALQERGRTRLNHKRRIGRPNVCVTNAKIFVGRGSTRESMTADSQFGCFKLKLEWDLSLLGCSIVKIRARSGERSSNAILVDILCPLYLNFKLHQEHMPISLVKWAGDTKKIGVPLSKCGETPDKSREAVLCLTRDTSSNFLLEFTQDHKKFLGTVYPGSQKMGRAKWDYKKLVDYSIQEQPC
ncbi:predicted protein [Nematostella vectensis]|uniref:Uncharacterized protein n=1 Tax=Nematostella vectensis TaxID=45351 RepID=A7SDB5_NEMVE|nr:predicted protein [Nematostella vectensis]|eukprot:XP_001630343.1 predicted protein [Nematostella vectensis]